jgi:glycosyltransferase involved in cell wall biosynthesis
MKILFLMLNLSNLDKPSGMYSDLIMEFVNNGHIVYPVAVSSKEKKTFLSAENGINVLRVKTLPLFDVNYIRKGIANLLLPFQYKMAIYRFYKNINPDLIILPTPPMTLGSLARNLKGKHNAKIYLILRDIFPQNAVDLGIIRNGSLLHKFFRRKEKNLYHCADTIGCMSQANIDYILKHNSDLEPDKIHILMNFQKSLESQFISLNNNKEHYGFKGKFVVVFGGNMGIPQKIENVLALARECLIFRDVVFLFIGEGTQLNRIKNFTIKENLSNIQFKNYIPRDEYMQLLKNCDVGLISLNEDYTIPNIPNKTSSYFDAGIPILASVDNATDCGLILERAGAGLVSQAGDLNAFFRNFCKLYNSHELRLQMGRNGKAFFNENMTSEKAYNTILRHV